MAIDPPVSPVAPTSSTFVRAILNSRGEMRNKEKNARIRVYSSCVSLLGGKFLRIGYDDL
jgi:hypothetical protein